MSMDNKMSSNVISERSYKVILLGDSGVGKSSISCRIKNGYFMETIRMTLGVGFEVLTFQKNHQLIVIQLWDILGHKLNFLYEFIKKQYSQGAQGIIIVYDITRWETFANLPKWLDIINNLSTIKILVGNKKDLEQHREVTIEEAEAFSKESDMFYLESSAKDGTNIDKIFNLLIEKLME